MLSTLSILSGINTIQYPYYPVSILSILFPYLSIQFSIHIIPTVNSRSCTQIVILCLSNIEKCRRWWIDGVRWRLWTDTPFYQWSRTGQQLTALFSPIAPFIKSINGAIGSLLCFQFHCAVYWINKLRNRGHCAVSPFRCIAPFMPSLWGWFSNTVRTLVCLSAVCSRCFTLWF